MRGGWTSTGCAARAPSPDDAPAGSARSPALAALRRPLTHYGLALAEHERQNGQLREANGELVLAALTAQDRQVAAERAQRQQKEFLASKRQLPSP